MKQGNQKTEFMSVRCTHKQKEVIEKRAKKIEKSLSEYMIDCAIAGTERKRNKDKKRAVKLIQKQEKINEIMRHLESKEELSASEQIIKKLLGEIDLWGNC